jgi:hypothetical protein
VLRSFSPLSAANAAEHGPLRGFDVTRIRGGEGVETAQHQNWSCGLVVILVCFFAVGSLEAATKSVEEFLAQKDRWKTQLDRKVVVEGRVSTMKGTTIILQKCSTIIEFRSDRPLPEANGSHVAEVEGTLAIDETSNRVYFQVSKVKLVPDDVSRVQKARGNLPRDEVGQWYALGEWALNRAKFYGKTDDPLYAEAKQMFGQAVAKERRLLKPRTPQSLRELAIKSRRYGIDEPTRTSILHESYFLEWQSIRLKDDSKNILGLASSVESALPGGSDALPEETGLDKLRAGYLAGVLKFYDETPDPAVRRKLHRLLYQTIVADALDQEKSPDGKNGKVLAKILTDYLPERIDEAKTYIAAERNWRLKNVQNKDRREMIALQEEFLEIGDKQNAALTLKKWFDQQETEQRRRGVDGLLQLATEYEYRMDMVTAEEEKERLHKVVTELLLDAFRKNQGLGTTQTRLEGYGFQLKDGVWRTPAQMEQFRNTPRQRAMAEGRVVPGMTNDEVFKSLGKPDRVTRVLTARNVIELWAYGAPDETPLVVRLVRTGNRKVSVVTDWKQLREEAKAPPEEAPESETGNPNVETGT